MNASSNDDNSTPKATSKNVGLGAFIAKLEYFWLVKLFAGSFVAGIISKLLIFVMTIILARQLTPQGYGEFTFIMGIAVIGAQIIALGLPTLMTRLVPTYKIKENWQKLRGIIHWSDSVIFLVFIVISFLIAGIAFLPIVNGDIKTGLLVSLLLLLPIAFNQLRRHQLAGIRRAPMGIMLDQGIAAIGVIFFAIIFGFSSALIAIVVFAIGSVISALFGSFYFHIKLPAKVWLAKPLFEPKIWIMLAMPLMLGISTKLLMDRMDILMLGPMVGFFETGYYGAAFRLTYLLTFPQVMIMAIITPLLSENIANGQIKKVWKFFWIAIILAVISVIPVGLISIMFNEQIITLIFGVQYSASASIFTLLIIAQIFTAFAIPCSGLLIASGKGKLFGSINLIALIINVGLNFIFIPQFGAIGAAITTIIGTAFILCAQALFIWINRNKYFLIQDNRKKATLKSE